MNFGETIFTYEQELTTRDHMHIMPRKNQMPHHLRIHSKLKFTSHNKKKNPHKTDTL